MALVAILALAPVFARAQQPEFPNGFAGMAGLALNGSARIHGPVLQLTRGEGHEAGSAFWSFPIDITHFTARFEFQLIPGTLNPLGGTADGFTFTIQGSPQGLIALGGGGGGLGYTGIANSVAVKFDLYNNAGEGSNSTAYS